MSEHFLTLKHCLSGMQGMKMVCIVHEKEGADIFQKEFWHGKVFFDPEKGFYKAFG